MQQNIILLNLSITLKMVDKCLTFAYNKSRNIPTFPISSTEVFFMIANTFIDNAVMDLVKEIRAESED